MSSTKGTFGLTRIAQAIALRGDKPDSNLRPDRNPSYFHGIIGEHPSCAECPLRHKKRVLPDGPVPARVAIVGEDPGYMEERYGKGFVGPSGSILWGVFGVRIGFRREEVWVTNSRLCRAESVRLSTGAILPKSEVRKIAGKCCRNRLLSELALVDPVVVIPVGNSALQQIVDSKKATIYSYRGSIQEVNLKGLADRECKRGGKI